jgi:hypothetical protein
VLGVFGVWGNKDLMLTWFSFLCVVFNKLQSALSESVDDSLQLPIKS